MRERRKRFVVYPIPYHVLVTMGDRRVITPRGARLYTKVHELIDPSTGYWDEILLRKPVL
jgi:hypothetical protein